MFDDGSIDVRPIEDVMQTIKAKAGEEFVNVRQARFRRPEDYVAAREQTPIKVSEYVDALLSGAAATYAGNQSLSSVLCSDFGIPPPPPFLDASTLEPPAYWLGPAGSITPLHKDSTDNFAVHVAGRKKWILFPVRDAPALELSRPAVDPEIDFAISAIDVANPQLDEFPGFAKAVGVEVIVEAGQLLYIPAGWGHYVENLTTSLMINFWMSRRSFRTLWGL